MVLCEQPFRILIYAFKVDLLLLLLAVDVHSYAVHVLYDLARVGSVFKKGNDR